MAGHILIVDDEESMCDLIAAGLERHGMSSRACLSAREALRALEVERFDAAIIDLHLEDMDGLELCARLSELCPDLPVVVVTGFGSLENAIGAIRAGAYDFLTKPFEMEQLGVTMARAVEHRAFEQEVKRLREAVKGAELSTEMIGESPAMRRVHEMILRVAPTDATVLISGESGTGKELIARALHQSGPRGKGPFVPVNCAAMPATLLESELFGHVKGAFTDARQARKGLFLEAQGGTLLLDEIGEMPAEMQAKLLRALQEHAVRPVGGTTEVPFDVRIIAATNKDLEAEVAQGRFREDLFYRLNVVRIEAPPLRARGHDVLLLAQHFLEKAAERIKKDVVGLSPPAAQKLRAYDWPGNVRELQNCMEQAVALTEHAQIAASDLPDKVRRFRAETCALPAEDPHELLPMEEVEARCILKVLRAVGGNKTAAARVLGFDRRTLYRKLEKIERRRGDEARA